MFGSDNTYYVNLGSRLGAVQKHASRSDPQGSGKRGLPFYILYIYQQRILRKNHAYNIKLL